MYNEITIKDVDQRKVFRPSWWLQCSHVLRKAEQKLDLLLVIRKKRCLKKRHKLSSPAEETIMRNRSHVFWTRKGYFCLELFNLNATKGKITRLLSVILSPLTISEYSRKVKGLVIESNQEVSPCWTKCGCGVSSSIVLWIDVRHREVKQMLRGEFICCTT